VTLAKAVQSTSCVVLALGLAACVPAIRTTPPAPTATAGSAPIDPARLSDIVRVLASDEFEGRAPGTRGEDKTVAYLSREFAALGLQPGGENGGWTQRVPLVRTQLQAGTVRIGDRVMTLGDHVYFSTVRPVDRARIDAPLVFVGYGVSAPERNWDDFKGIDLTGKVAVMLVNDPDFEATADETVAGRFGGQANDLLRSLDLQVR